MSDRDAFIAEMKASKASLDAKQKKVSSFLVLLVYGFGWGFVVLLPRSPLQIVVKGPCAMREKGNYLPDHMECVCRTRKTPKPLRLHNLMLPLPAQDRN